MFHTFEFQMPPSLLLSVILPDIASELVGFWLQSPETRIVSTYDRKTKYHSLGVPIELMLLVDHIDTVSTMHN
jgi:hypothetical protein